MELNGNNYDLSREDVLITSEDIPGWQVAQDGDITVALDTTLSEELKKEGLARELVNRIQNLRKDSDFNVIDRINVYIENNETLAGAMNDFSDYVKNEVLADRIAFKEDVDGEEQEIAEAGKTRVRVERIG